MSRSRYIWGKWFLDIPASHPSKLVQDQGWPFLDSGVSLGAAKSSYLFHESVAITLITVTSCPDHP